MVQAKAGRPGIGGPEPQGPAAGRSASPGTHFESRSGTSQKGPQKMRGSSGDDDVVRGPSSAAARLTVSPCFSFDRRSRREEESRMTEEVAAAILVTCLSRSR